MNELFKVSDEWMKACGREGQRNVLSVISNNAGEVYPTVIVKDQCGKAWTVAIARGEFVNIEEIKEEFQRKINVVFPEVGLDPGKAVVKAWVRYDEDDKSYFPCIAFRYNGLPSEAYGERCDVYDREERAFWPCTTCHGYRLNEALRFVVQFIEGAHSRIFID